MEEKIELLSSHYDFWDKLTESEKSEIAESCSTLVFEKGSIVHQAEDKCRGAFLIIKGQLRVYLISENGRDVTLYRLGEGSHCVLAASCLLDSIVFDVMIEAVERTDALIIPVTTLHRLMNQNADVGLFLYKESAERFSDVMWTLQQILFMGIDQRIASFLWDESLSKGDVIKITHEEIARYIGSAREVVSKILKLFAEENIVTLGRGCITIIDKEKLKKKIE